MSQPPMNTRQGGRVLRRYKMVISLVTLLGVIFGIAFELMLFPAKVSSSALVLVAPPAKVNISTYPLLVTSEDVLSGAVRTLGSGISVAELSGDVKASSPSANAVRITATARTAGQAEDDANAVADSFAAYIQSAHVGASLKVQTPSVTPATSATSSHEATDLVVAALIGAVAGFLTGFTIALRRARGDRRLVQRDEFAGAVGVPVIAAVHAADPADAARWLGLFDSYQPTAAGGWRFRGILERLGVTADRSASGNGGVRVAFLSLAADRKALALGPQFAAFSASLGIPTAFVISAPGDAGVTAALRAACGTARGPVRGGMLKLGLDTGADAGGVPGARLTVVTTVVGEESRRLPDVARAHAAVLGATAGSVTADQLAWAATLAAEAGSVVAGIVVANPDPDDKTTGVAPRPAGPARRALPTRHVNGREARTGDRTRPADWAAYGGR